MCSSYAQWVIATFNQITSEKHCRKTLEMFRWNGQPACPYCKSVNVTSIEKEARYHCNTCYTSFSVTVNSIFHRTHLPLQKWFLAIWLLWEYEKDYSVRELGDLLNINKNTAHRITQKFYDAIYLSHNRQLFEDMANEVIGICHKK